VTVESFSLPLAAPLTVGDEVIRVRTGLRLHLKGVTGQVGRGDIAPLPGISPDDLASAQAQVEELLARITDQDLETLSTATLLPSVRLGLEMAAQDLAWQERGTATRWAGQSVPLNALVLAEQTDLTAAVNSLLDVGYTSLKVKVGRQALDHDIAAIRQIRDLCQGRATLRLDANARWTLDEAVTFGIRLGPEGIDYMEEPVSDSDQVQAFHEATGFPLALDARDPAAYVPRPGVTTWVLKPAVLGGIGACRTLCARARQTGLRVVLSSIFESTHALRFYARLAFALNLAEIPQGLDTWRCLAGGPEDLTFRAGRLEL
jgi:o-succinylbenzoate synthase